MKLTLKNAAFALALCGLASCANEAPWGNGSRGKGGIDLKLTADADVKDALPSVRAGAPELVAPDVAAFSISMLNLDTEQEQTWRTLEEFNAFSQEQGFDVGTYTLTAFYGNINDCGFYKPYFMGKADVNVLEGRESSVDVTAQLANVMLSVDYTDAFRGYFRDFSVTAHTDGHANVVFGRSETRAGFIAPGDVTLQLTMTNLSGQTVTITPAQFPAVARHHYHVTFDVNADPMGGATLEIVFDDSLTSQNVTFNLSDELYNAEAPIVHTEGFTSGQVFEALSGNSAPSQIKFESICKAGIQSAVLKIAQVGGSQQYTPPFDTELDLVQADESTQYQLGENGIKVAGIFKNPEQMAIVDLTDLPRYLPEGTFEITFTVTDALGRNNEEPVILNLSTLPIHLEVTGGSALYDYPGTTVTTTPTVDATVMITYNGLKPNECISFKNKCRTGIFKDCDIVDVKESLATRSFDDKIYIFNIKVCDVETSPLPMELWLNGEKKADFTLDIIEPEYRLIADPFATYARFKVETANSEDLPTIVNGLTLYKNGTAVDKSLITTDPEKGFVTMDGLDSDKDYTIGFSLTTRPDGIPESQTLRIHTESKVDVPNGDFSKTTQTINHQKVDVSGKYRYTATYQPTANIVVREADNWASINANTCWWDSSGAKNTWFQVPSTFAENGKVVLRNVAYDHNGKKPDDMPYTLGKNYWYNTNVPTFTMFAAGQMFLGSYSYDGTEHRVDGIEFFSRPTSIEFEYTYVPTGDDHAYMEISVLNSSGQTIASSKKVINKADNSKMTVSMPEYKFGEKAAKLLVCFKSSSSSNPKDYVHIPQGSELDEGFNAGHFGNIDLGDNNYHAVATGSVLTIDNVKLNY
ncbi:MAG: DUF4493 domain-containing protein [Muribaculaceae bacterium]|nr:DUF4493 domain-containing protein [Muribaculaceae bacterium]